MAIALATTAGLLLLAAAGIWLRSNALITVTYDVALEDVAFPSPDSAVIERGRHLVDAVGLCRECHGEDLAGAWLVDDPVFARIQAANITPGGVVADYTDGDWVRILRHGVLRNGRSAVIMPSESYRYLSNADLGALVGYLRSIPAREGSSKGMRPGPIARVLIAFGPLQAVFVAATILADTMPVPVATVPDTSAAYGYYLAQVSGCIGCHGQDLSGGPVPGAEPGAPPAANITPGGIGSWDFATFDRAMREGVSVAGRMVDESMPRRPTMTTVEMTALWHYLRSLPSRALGS